MRGIDSLYQIFLYKPSYTREGIDTFNCCFCAFVFRRSEEVQPAAGNEVETNPQKFLEEEYLETETKVYTYK